MKRPDNLDITNWRTHPLNQWSFQHVREILPTARITTGDSSNPWELDLEDLGNLPTSGVEQPCSMTQLLRETSSDSLVVLHHGRIKYEWAAPHGSCGDQSSPHILFSISKSVTAMLAGILQDRGLINPQDPVTRYLPGARNSVYGDCTIRHLLDMSVALDFQENYIDPHSEYMLYRQATAWNAVNQLEPGPALEEFLYGLQKSDGEHGEAFLYRSPNSDLLGLLLQRVAGKPFAELLGELLWHPIGAASEGYISLDRLGAPRAAGGICFTPRDSARLGQLFLDGGSVNGHQVISPQWIDDTFNNGDQDAWDRGNYAYKLPYGCYRNKWYQVGDEDGCISARGIHGQIIYVNPTRHVVICRMSCQAEPLNETWTRAWFKTFAELSRELSEGT